MRLTQRIEMRLNGLRRRYIKAKFMKRLMKINTSGRTPNNSDQRVLSAVYPNHTVVEILAVRNTTGGGSGNPHVVRKKYFDHLVRKFEGKTVQAYIRNNVSGKLLFEIFEIYHGQLFPISKI